MGDRFRSQITLQPSGLEMRIIKKAAVTVDFRISPFLKDLLNSRTIQCMNELSAPRILNAMNRPKNLLKPVQLIVSPGFLPA